MTTRVVEQTIRSIADAKGVQPAEMDFVLQNWVDTDALRQLVEHHSEKWKLQFEIPNHTVTVTGENVILVDGTKERTFS